MSEIEEPQQQSIQARIAALNLGQVGRSPVGVSVPPKTSPRPPPPKPPLDRAASAVSPNASSISNGIGNEPNGPSRGVLPPPNIVRTGQKDDSSKPAPPPRLPPRRESTLQQQQSAPALPPRRPSELSRKGSQESVSSVVSSVSALSNGTSRSISSRTASSDNSRVRAPVYDPATLPPLPPSRRDQQEKASSNTATTRAPLKAAKSTSYITPRENQPSPRTPTLPQRPSPRGSSPNAPSLPSRPPLPQRTTSSEAPPPPTYTRRLPPTTIPPVKPRTENAPTMPTRPDLSSETPQTNGFNKAPPPVPMSTRPDLSKIMATKPKMSVTQPSTASVDGAMSQLSCLKCRDFAGPDSHAAQFPRQNVPSLDWLALQLTDPFPSPTDKARAIFAWLHHNIDYNVEAFFNHTVKPSTPANTLNTGLAVCEGYAGLFTALATKAGLESIVVGGHGKGYGIEALKPGEPVPPKSSNHAWNAVKIDNGEWKLIDSCWGAGHINGPGQPYSRKFNATEFTKTNEEFGLKHFPNDPGHFFRSDGRILTWEDYIVGEHPGQPANVFADPDEGFSNNSYMPTQLKVSTEPSAHTGPTVRFQFQRTCEHWDPMRNGKGKPYQYVVSVGTPVSGPARDFLPFDTNGTFWWVDVPVSDLGKPGERVMCAAVETLNGKDARGLTKAEFLKAKGRSAVTFKGFATWELI